MRVHDRRRATDAERSLVGVFRARSQLECEQIFPMANGQRLRGREQRRGNAVTAVNRHVEVLLKV
jgi:hypothetical protein